MENTPSVLTQSENENFQMWKYVLSVSESIVADMQKGQMGREDLLSCLSTIEEVFGKSIDPVDDFQGFVLQQFCRSVRRSLEILKK